MKRILVVAPHYRAAEIWAHENRVTKNSWTPVLSNRDLRGYSECPYVVVNGGSRDREILYTLKAGRHHWASTGELAEARGETDTRELLELADAIDREASISSRPGQLYTLEAIATRLRQLADKETP